jgi:hypothetical protein
MKKVSWVCSRRDCVKPQVEDGALLFLLELEVLLIQPSPLVYFDNRLWYAGKQTPCFGSRGHGGTLVLADPRYLISDLPDQIPRLGLD